MLFFLFCRHVAAMGENSPRLVGQKFRKRSQAATHHSSYISNGVPSVSMNQDSVKKSPNTPGFGEPEQEERPWQIFDEAVTDSSKLTKRGARRSHQTR
jgi:hypothetical protein